jgi:hypothetical protein
MWWGKETNILEFSSVWVVRFIRTITDSQWFHTGGSVRGENGTMWTDTEGQPLTTSYSSLFIIYHASLLPNLKSKWWNLLF